MRGTLIVFEGCDGTGKSSIAADLVEHLRSEGKRSQLYSFPGREQGTLGGLVYELHHERHSALTSPPVPEALQCLHIAAHLDSIQRLIKPALERDEIVILDRFWWSTYVYGVVGGANKLVLEHLLRAEVVTWGEIVPTCVFLLERSGPLRPENLDPWQRCRIEYTTLALKEGTRYPVHIVQNDAERQDALNLVLTALENKRK